MLKVVAAAAVALAVGLPSALAAETPSGKPAMHSHQRTCFDAPWQSQEWKDCEAKMQMQHGKMMQQRRPMMQQQGKKN